MGGGGTLPKKAINLPRTYEKIHCKENCNGSEFSEIPWYRQRSSYFYTSINLISVFKTTSKHRDVVHFLKVFGEIDLMLDMRT